MSDLAMTSVIFLAVGFTLLVGGSTGSVWLGGLAGVAILGAAVTYAHFKDKKRRR